MLLVELRRPKRWLSILMRQKTPYLIKQTKRLEFLPAYQYQLVLLEERLVESNSLDSPSVDFA